MTPSVRSGTSIKKVEERGASPSGSVLLQLRLPLHVWFGAGVHAVFLLFTLSFQSDSDPIFLWLLHGRVFMFLYIHSFIYLLNPFCHRSTNFQKSCEIAFSRDVSIWSPDDAVSDSIKIRCCIPIRDWFSVLISLKWSLSSSHLNTLVEVCISRMDHNIFLL